MFGKTKRIHFVGIGGVSMSGIAEVLLNQGFQVSGSDIRQSETTERLKNMGMDIYIGHSADNLGDSDVLVFTSTVPPTNPEIVSAKERKIPVIPRIEMLAELMRLKFSIAIAGTHGKTTTTAMVASILEHGGLDPTVADGGIITGLGSNIRLGGSEFMVVEADEAYGSIHKVSASIAVVTNIDNDHLDYYQNMEAIKKAFLDYINRIPFFGVAILCLDEENIQELIPNIEKRFMTYGIETQAEFTASDIQVAGTGSTYTANRDGQPLGKIKIKLPGRHNVSNSLAAVAVGVELDIPFEKIAEGLEAFPGVRHRFELLGDVNNILVIDDYGHHPTEIRATLNAARETYDRRLIAIFQPHRYSRVSLLADDFARCFYQADILIVTEIYSALEEPIEGTSGEKLAEAAKKYGHKNVIYIPDKEDIPHLVCDMAESGDLIITLGAGDIWKVGKTIVDKLEK
ncbi:UDP-N-acetylmuramate--L-alanine ligase [Candidatus Poribacteria bacterium]|nr:UDP-N-acetylmuramate--L-alanine ligase [Candidatus Poribacteria bacterium]